MNKFRVTQVGVAINFENKLRDTLMYLIDRVEWPTFYIELSKFVDLLQNLRNNEVTIIVILDRWIKREQELSILSTKVVGLPNVSKIEFFLIMSLTLYNIS